METVLTPVTTSHKNVLILYVDAGSTTPSGLLSRWEDELAASLVQKSYHLSRLGCDTICSRLNSCARQSASKPAECQRFGECVYVASGEQGHLITPSSQPPLSYTVPSFSEPASAQQGLMDWLYMSLEGSSDYKAEMCRSCMMTWQGTLRNVQWWVNALAGFCGCQCRYSFLAYSM